MKSVHDAGAVLNPFENGSSGRAGLIRLLGGVFGSDTSGFSGSIVSRGITDPTTRLLKEKQIRKTRENRMI